ncbi:MAG TPA: hypothetical protein VHM02_07350, partial [Thermoanaerobaculia bacterium]|nr:hypothetical protein [Thermoanaerobaculia bacterium]
RGNALFLAPGLALAWWLAPRRAAAASAGVAAGAGRGRRLAHLAALAVAALVVVAPHFALRAAAFGDPLHDENWKNLAWKLHGYPDWSYLDRVPYAGPGELLREEAGAVLAAWGAELARFAGAGLAQLLGTWLHVLAFAAGAAGALAGRRRREAGWLLAAAGLFVAGIALVFFTWGRLLLVVLPVAAALTSAPWAALAPGLAARLPGPLADPARRLRLVRLALAAAALLLVAVLGAKSLFFRLPAFVARHPVREVAAARELAAASPPGTVLAGTSPFLGRYLDRRYVDLPDAFGPETAAPARYYRRLARLVATEGIDFLVIGRLDLRDRPPALLGAEPPVPWLAPAGGDERVRIWRVVPERLPPAAS